MNHGLRIRICSAAVNKDETIMSNKNSNDSRRKLLKSIAAGTGAAVVGKSLPESWSKPVVDSVMLPAHAATTAADSSSTDNDCCDIAGTYCGFFDKKSDIKITVDAAGNVKVELWIDEVVKSTTVACTGGEFYIDFGQGSYVDGLVECGTGEIIGYVNWYGKHRYRATIDICKWPPVDE